MRCQLNYIDGNTTPLTSLIIDDITNNEYITEVIGDFLNVIDFFIRQSPLKYIS